MNKHVKAFYGNASLVQPEIYILFYFFKMHKGSELFERIQLDMHRINNLISWKIRYIYEE